LKRGKVVFENENGKAVYEWHKENGQPLYRIYFNDGRQMWTNSKEIIENELVTKKGQRQLPNPTPQLTLF